MLGRATRRLWLTVFRLAQAVVGLVAAFCLFLATTRLLLPYSGPQVDRKEEGIGFLITGMVMVGIVWWLLPATHRWGLWVFGADGETPERASEPPNPRQDDAAREERDRRSRPSGSTNERDRSRKTAKKATRDPYSIDLYEVLQVSPNAEQDIIDAAYKRLARKYHPDINSSPTSERKMKRINLAYEVLRDPEQREIYDARRGSR